MLYNRDSISEDLMISRHKYIACLVTPALK